MAGCVTSQNRRSSGPHLRILPSGRQEIRAGKNLVLTCRAQVPNIELVKHLKWINPRGEDIPQDDRWGHNHFQSNCTNNFRALLHPHQSSKNILSKAPQLPLFPLHCYFWTLREIHAQFLALITFRFVNNINNSLYISPLIFN